MKRPSLKRLVAACAWWALGLSLAGGIGCDAWGAKKPAAPAALPSTVPGLLPGKAATPSQASSKGPGETAPAATPEATPPAPTQPQTEIAQTAPPEPPPSVVPPSPASPYAAKAYAVLDRHCARCHQVGKLNGLRAAHDFANVLAVDEIAQDRSLIVPGHPDVSRLYSTLLAHTPHYDVSLDSAETDALTSDEAAAVRDWIAELAPQTTAAQVCVGRKFVTPEMVGAALADALTTASAPAPLSQPPLSPLPPAPPSAPSVGEPAPAPASAKPDIAATDPAGLRFLSLVDLYNACASEAELDGYRQAIAKLLNSLSWAKTPIKLEAFGPGNALIKVPITELGWVPAHWQRMVESYTFPRLPALQMPQAVQEATGTSRPVLPAAWFASALSWPKLYHELLGLPSTELGLQRILGVEVRRNVEKSIARRAAVRLSALIKGPRMIERHPTRFGSLWLAYDFSDMAGQRNIFEHPLGPEASPLVREPFKPDGVRTMFTLPNGFMGYVLFGRTGERRETSSTTLEIESDGPTGPSGNGETCISCHAGGVKPVKDDMRAYLDANPAAPKALRDTLFALHPEQSELDKLLAEDEQRFARAQTDAGVTPTLMIHGLEPVRALARQYEKQLDLVQAAAEFGLEVEPFAARVAQVQGDTAYAAHELLQGLVTRPELDRVFSALLKMAPIDPMAGEKALAATPAHDIAKEQSEPANLIVWSDKRVYEVGQVASFHVHTTTDCHLRLINVDASGKAVVLFPNDFETNDLISAAKDLDLPPANSPYQFRLKAKGTETLIASCTAGSASSDGIDFDFEKERFRVLGDWRAYLSDKFEAMVGRAGPEKEKPKKAGLIPPAGPGAAAAAAQQPLEQVPRYIRKAITFEVR